MLLSCLMKRTILVSGNLDGHSVSWLNVVPDNVCIESLSIDLTRPMLDSATRSVTKLGEKIDEYGPCLLLFRVLTNLERIKKTDAAKLQDEYAKLVEGLQEATAETSTEDAFMANPGSYKVVFP